MEATFNLDDFIVRLERAKDNYEEQVRLQSELMRYFIAAPSEEQTRLRSKVQFLLEGKFSSLENKITDTERKRRDQAA